MSRAKWPEQWSTKAKRRRWLRETAAHELRQFEDAGGLQEALDDFGCDDAMAYAMAAELAEVANSIEGKRRGQR